MSVKSVVLILLRDVGDGHSSVSEDSSDGGASKRARFRAAGDGGDESAPLVIDTRGDGAGGGYFFLRGCIGVPFHMALRIIATLRCFFHCLSLGLTSSSILRLSLAGALPKSVGMNTYVWG